MSLPAEASVANIPSCFSGFIITGISSGPSGSTLASRVLQAAGLLYPAAVSPETEGLSEKSALFFKLLEYHWH
jgi:hypothetical protein